MKALPILFLMVSVNAWTCGWQPDDPLTTNFVEVGNNFSTNYLNILSAYHNTTSGFSLDTSGSVNSTQQQEQRKPLRDFMQQHHLIFPGHDDGGSARAYEGHYCQTNNIDSVAVFFEAVRTEGESMQALLPALLKKRLALTAICRRVQKTQVQEETKEQSSEKDTHGFFAYLNATRHFYLGDMAQAEQAFAELQTAKSAWVKETSLYMLGRTRLIQAQAQWDGNSRVLGAIDAPAIKKAEAAYNEYLRQYPQGRYAVSATNLKRRVYWFLDDTERLSRALVELYGRIRNNPSPNEFNEIRRFFTTKKTAAYSSPWLSAVAALRHGALPDWNVIRSQQAQFASYPDLYTFLTLWDAFHAQQWHAVITDKQMSAMSIDVAKPVHRSILALQARAHTQLRQYDKAAALWKKIDSAYAQKKDEYVQSYWILNAMQAGQHREISRSAPLAMSAAFRSYITDYASDQQLIDLLQDVKVNLVAMRSARHAYLYYLLISNQYQKFVLQYDKLAEKGNFVSVSAPARLLVQNPDNPNGLVNVGHFLMEHSQDPRYQQDHSVYAKEIGTQCRFNSKVLYTPYRYFLKVVESHKNGKKSDDEARALHYLVRCFRPGTAAAQCGSAVDASATPEIWFRQLKSKYPRSKWAQATPFWYKPNG